MADDIDTSRPRATIIRRWAVTLILALAIGGCQDSCTPKPQCAPGQHAVRAPSHQGRVWECADIP